MESAASTDAVASALRTLRTEQAGLQSVASALEGPLGGELRRAVEIIGAIGGRVIVSGVGKSGHVGAKIAATLASTGTPAFFVHPSEANHGDLGMIARDDAVIAISWSGETSELRGTLDYSRRFSLPLIAITSAVSSTLADHADVVLALPREREACPHNLAPTTSSLMTLALGDALAVALLESRDFSASDFRVFHPGGQLGAKLSRLRDLMHKGQELPLVASGTRMTEAILQISQKGFGCVGVTDGEGRLAGIVTDGDLRRHLSTDLLGETVDDIMTRTPLTAGPDTLASEALELLNQRNVSALMVLEDERPVGIVHLHDLLRAGVA